MLKPGDKVTRMLAGCVAMEMQVEKIENNQYHCTVNGVKDAVWTFDVTTGFEIDEELGWGPAHGYSGSYLVLTREQ